MIPFINEKATKDLNDIKKIFNKYKIKFFLEFGTCLGAVRDKNFINGDNDIDIGVIEKTSNDQKHSAYQELKSIGFKVIIFGQHKGDVVDLRRGVETNLHFYHVIENGVLGGIDKYIFMDPQIYLKLNDIEFLNNIYQIPSNTEEYLTMCYGKNWKIPNSKHYRHPKKIKERKIK